MLKDSHQGFPNKNIHQSVEDGAFEYYQFGWDLSARESGLERRLKKYSRHFLSLGQILESHLIVGESRDVLSCLNRFLSAEDLNSITQEFVGCSFRRRR